MTITADRLIRFVRQRGEWSLKTPARQKEFVARAVGDGIEIEPKSTGTPRSISRKRIERFCEEYEESGSKDPGAYREISFDASYLLAIVEIAERAGNT